MRLFFLAALLIVFMLPTSRAKAGLIDFAIKKATRLKQGIKGQLGSIEDCGDAIQEKVIANANKYFKTCEGFVEIKFGSTIPKPPDNEVLKCKHLPSALKEFENLKMLSCLSVGVLALAKCKEKVRATDDYVKICKDKFEKDLLNSIENDIKSGNRPAINDNPTFREDSNLNELCNIFKTTAIEQCLMAGCIPSAD